MIKTNDLTTKTEITKTVTLSGLSHQEYQVSNKSKSIYFNKRSTPFKLEHKRSG